MDHTSALNAEVDILYLAQTNNPIKGRAVLAKLETGVFITFAHDLKTWKFKIAATQEDAISGRGAAELLFAANGHYVGQMEDEVFDNIIGMASTLYLLQAKLPKLPAPEKKDAAE